MKVVRHSDSDFESRLKELTRASSLFDRTIEERTQAIIDSVRVGGDVALIELTERFDGARLRADQLAITRAELLAASVKADPRLRQAVDRAAKNIERFSRKSLRRDWSMRNGEGAKVGEKFDPYRRVGIYIPGGSAPLVSTALMTITLARVAGCEQIVACTPASRNGSVNSALLYAMRKAGATEIYRVGGAQAIAAMALGTATILPVQKIFGPGNAYVVAAKRLLFGYVGIDLLPGPSEVLVLADESAAPDLIAADLLAQAEHGSGHERLWLVTPSGKLVRAVHAEVIRQAARLPRREFIERALEMNGWLVQVRNLEQAITLTNEIAPEHCEVMTRNPSAVARKIVTAGAIFHGPFSPTVLGDYVAGPSHTLPTGGAGAAFSGLTVDQFQRRTSLVQYDRAALQKALPWVEQFARVEGLEAHAASARIRLKR